MAQQRQGISPEAEELTRLRLEMQLPESLGPRFTGLGPVAGKVYFSRAPLVVGTLGDLTFLAPEGGLKSSNVSRLNLMVGGKFARSLIANAALSVQNGGAVDSHSGGAARVEYAYVDFLTGEDSGLRVGNVLIPVGVTNLRSEPTLYPTVRRAKAETAILPSTWHENGVLAFGHIGAVVLQGGFVNGGDASRYTAAGWIHGGAQDGAQAKAQNTAWVARAEWLDPATEASAGVSVYFSGSNQGDSSLGRAEVFFIEAHDEFEWRQFSGKLQYIEGWLTDTDRILAVTHEAVGRRARGAEITLEYDLLPRLARLRKHFVDHPTPPDWKSLPIFVSWEHVNPQVESAEGSAIDPRLRTDAVIFGLNYKPHPQVVVKGDFASETSGAGQTERVFEIGLGFAF